MASRGSSLGSLIELAESNFAKDGTEALASVPSR